MTILTATNLPDSMQDPRTAAIVRDLVAVYDASFLPGGFKGITASRQPWITRSQELVAIARAKQAGLVEEASN